MMIFYESRTVSLVDLPLVMGFLLLAEGFLKRRDVWVRLTFLSIVLERSRHFETVKFCCFVAKQ